eukprot:TRINITY_DN43251_c0_g1_i1.p1 TRINITY_DN43251_c0_g1~~TRINITY_DN43251_c0_g1_i1.p1  ORF type:complete len:199 (+),score=40.67 TRINITY_DN43251_c0_g1_i1:55-651(+)
MYISFTMFFFVLGSNFQSCSFLSNAQEKCDASYSGAAAYRMKGRSNHMNSHVDLDGRSNQHKISLLDVNGYRMSSNESAAHELKLSRSMVLQQHLFWIVLLAALFFAGLILAVCYVGGSQSSDASAETETRPETTKEELGQEKAESESPTEVSMANFFADDTDDEDDGANGKIDSGDSKREQSGKHDAESRVLRSSHD